MRYSKQRELVLQKVEQLCDHPTAEEIFDLAAKECPGLSLGTVYRNLNSLVDAGRGRRVSIPGKADRFDHTLGWHSHLYCNCCGGVVDADVDEKQVMKLVRNQKGVVQDCAVVLFGLCEAIADTLKVPCSCAEDPQNNVVIGCGRALENMADLGKFLDDGRRRMLGRA